MKKIIGIFSVMLLIGTALPSFGMINEHNSINFDYINDYWDNEFVPGEFIVKFKEKLISSLSVDNLNEKYQVYSTEKVFKDAEDTILEHIYKFKVPLDSDIFSIVGDYSILDNVVYAEPNCIGHALSIPNDEYFPIQWSLDNNGQIIFGDKAGTLSADISAVEAWDIEAGSEEIIIAIIDTGVDYTHPDLVDNIWVNADEIIGNEIDDDGNGYVDDYYGYDFFNLDGNPIDDGGHGTHCSGIAAAAGNNGIGIAGVAWNCKIMSVKVMSGAGYGDYEKFAEGIKYAADNGANVFSMSFGWSYEGSIVKNAIDYSYDKGIVLVAAAGNSNSSDKMYPSGYDNVIAVGASNQNDERCDVDDWGYYGIIPKPMGSHYGYWVDVAAPGNLIYSSLPTYQAWVNDEENFNTGENWTMNYDFMFGTSMATPHVAGLAGLILSQKPTLTNDKVRRIIRANTDPYNSEEYIGTGRINAYKALMELNTQPETPTKPLGETNGRPDREYSFTTSATDSDGDQLWYFWDWGDGNYSDWLGPFNSGDTCEAPYTWQQEANFSIMVKVKDGEGGESYWSDELLFSTPKIKIINYLLFERLLSRFPILKFLI